MKKIIYWLLEKSGCGWGDKVETKFQKFLYRLL